MITITHGRRVTIFDDALRAVRVFDDFGKGGETVFRPAEEWASPEARREAEERVAGVDEPRRRRARATKEKG